MTKSSNVTQDIVDSFAHGAEAIYSKGLLGWY